MVAIAAHELGDLVETGYRPPKLWARSKDVWAQRDLLLNLTRRELKVRHKNSFIGVFWNLLNPLLNLAVYSAVFGVILKSGLPRYPLKLLSGMVIYHLFSFSVQSATTSITSSAPLVKKIWFAREILPLSSVASQFVTFLSRFLILAIGLAAFGQSPEWGMIWMLIPAIIITMVMATGLGLLLGSLNVFFRDVQHFLDLILLALFWLTPIVYLYDHIANGLVAWGGPGAERLALINPMIPIVVTFQRVLYNPTNFSLEEQEKFAMMLRPTSWYVQNLAWSAFVAVVLLYAGLRVFAKLEGQFAERL